MFTIVSLHSSFELSKRTMILLIIRYIDLGRSRPDNNNTCTMVSSFKFSDILAQSLHHIPSCRTILHIVTIQTLRIILIKCGLHWHYFLKFFAYRVNIFLLEYLGIHSCLIRILRINIPCTKNDIFKIGQWHNFTIRKIFFVRAFAYSYFVVLRH